MTETPPEDDRAPLEGPNDSFEQVETAVSTDYKVLGQKDAPDGTGVLGHNTATSGTAYGLEGVTDSDDPSAAGLRARAPNGGRGVEVSANTGIGILSHSIGGPGIQASSDQNYAGFLSTADGGLAGLRSFNFADANTSSSGYGVEASTDAVGDGAAGVYGQSTQGSGQTFGIHGETQSSETSAAGVYGQATQGSGAIYGVLGETQSSDADAAGVYGQGTGSAAAVKADGHVDISDVGVSAYLSGDQTIPADLTYHTIEFDEVRNDDFGGLDPSTGVYTVPVDGDYHVSAHVDWFGAFSSDAVDYGIKNHVSAQATEDGSAFQTLSKTLFGLNSGETIEIWVRPQTSEDKDLQGGSWTNTSMTIHKVG